VLKYPLAVRVKREDVTDNMNSGGPELPQSLLRRWEKTLQKLDREYFGNNYRPGDDQFPSRQLKFRIDGRRPF